MPSTRTAKVAEGVGNAPTSTNADPVFETGAASLYLPAFRGIYDFGFTNYDYEGARGTDFDSQIVIRKSQFKNGCQTWTRTMTSGLTGRRATLTPSGNGAAGRISTCIVPFRRRMPRMFDHGSKGNGGLE